MDFSTNISRQRRRAVGVCVVLVGALVLGPRVSAQVELPLDGYIRAGRCMPVRVDGSVRRLDAPVGVPTHVAPGVAGIVPLLILSESPGALKAGSVELPLRALRPDQRLVGVVGQDQTLAGQMFPGQTIIAVALDASRPLPGPALAWETLDAVIVDAAPPNLAELLAAGITIAVRSAQPPDQIWPWRALGQAWVLRAEPAGPTGSIGGDFVYLPTRGGSPGRPAGLRPQMVLVAVLVLLLLMSTLLIRGRNALLAILAIAIVCATAIELWRRGLPALSTAGGSIIVHTPTLTQRDTWTYLATGSRASTESFEAIRPIPASIPHAQTLNLSLHCDVGGVIRWTCHLPPNTRLATLQRSVQPPESSPPTLTPVTSPLHDLARQAYLRAGSRIVGQVPGDGWPSVVVHIE